MPPAASCCTGYSLPSPSCRPCIGYRCCGKPHNSRRTPAPFPTFTTRYDCHRESPRQDARPRATSSSSRPGSRCATARPAPGVAKPLDPHPRSPGWLTGALRRDLLSALRRPSVRLPRFPSHYPAQSIAQRRAAARGVPPAPTTHRRQAAKKFRSGEGIRAGPFAPPERRPSPGRLHQVRRKPHRDEPADVRALHRQSSRAKAHPTCSLSSIGTMTSRNLTSVICKI